jgi:hypothetical protein
MTQQADTPEAVTAFARAIRDIARNPNESSGDYSYGRTRDALRTADPERLKHFADYLSAYDPAAAARADASDGQRSEDRTDDGAAYVGPREQLARDLDGSWKSRRQREYENGGGRGGSAA